MRPVVRVRGHGSRLDSTSGTVSHVLRQVGGSNGLDFDVENQWGFERIAGTQPSRQVACGWEGSPGRAKRPLLILTAKDVSRERTFVPGASRRSCEVVFFQPLISIKIGEIRST